MQEAGLEDVHIDGGWGKCSWGVRKGKPENGPRIVLAGHTDTFSRWKQTLTLKQDGNRYSVRESEMIQELWQNFLASQEQ